MGFQCWQPSRQMIWNWWATLKFRRFWISRCTPKRNVWFYRINRNKFIILVEKFLLNAFVKIVCNIVGCVFVLYSDYFAAYLKEPQATPLIPSSTATAYQNKPVFAMIFQNPYILAFILALILLIILLLMVLMLVTGTKSQRNAQHKGYNDVSQICVWQITNIFEINFD